MENLIKILSLLNNSTEQKQKPAEIPKEVSSQYPYGEFPIRYTRHGQEEIRKSSENRFSYNEQKQEEPQPQSNIDIASLLPLIQLMSSKNNQPRDMFKILSKLLFKDNKDLEKLFDLLPKQKPVEIKSENEFPDTNKVKISSLRKINE